MRYAVAIICLVLVASCAPSAESAQPAITQTQIATAMITVTPKPAATPRPTRTIRPTQEISKPGCFQWDKVDESANGEEVCVFGNVLFAGSAADGNGDILFWLVRFNEDPTTFYVLQDALPFEFQSGDCIAVSGELQFDDTNTPFIENGEMTKC